MKLLLGLLKTRLSAWYLASLTGTFFLLLSQNKIIVEFQNTPRAPTLNNVLATEKQDQQQENAYPPDTIILYNRIPKTGSTVR